MNATRTRKPQTQDFPTNLPEYHHNFDFDAWATAVKQQMLAVLRAKSSQ
jgi:hypothetical protein